MLNKPTRTVTFLFTDIEGSTQRWDRQSDAMAEALHRHNAILDEAIEANRGHVFKTEGDAFCSVFSIPADALAAALSAQRNLAAEAWGETGSIQVRMALHTGTPYESNDDYYGPSLSVVARLLGLAKGRQIVLSAATQQIVRAALPPGVQLRDLGDAVLKGLSQPERVFQVVADGLDNNPIPLARRALPVPLTAFVGREREMALLAGQIERNHLVTITGPGGVGKTRLMLESAATLAERYPDGVYLVELAAFNDPGAVMEQVAEALGVEPNPTRPLQESVLDYLAGRQVLLLLDNCEHLRPASAGLLRALLPRCGGLRVMVTSREPLGVSGEVLQPLSPLPVPAPAEVLSPEEAGELASVRLFLSLISQGDPNFELPPESMPVVCDICRRLEGVPLAIELAAPLYGQLSLQDMSSKLAESLDLLASDDPTDKRHSTLRATIDWSYRLLSEPGALLFKRLSVFVGGWSLKAAEAICVEDGLDKAQIVPLLRELASKALLIKDDTVDTRYRMLEMIREYARDLLQATSEAASLTHKHAVYFAGMAKRAEGPMWSPAHRFNALQRLETDYDDLLAALEWSTAHKEHAELCLQLITALAWFWEVRGHLTEGRTRLKAVLKATASVQDRSRADALDAAARLAYLQGDYAAAAGFHEKSLKIKRRIAATKSHAGHTWAVIGSLNNLGLVAIRQGDNEAAGKWLKEALALGEERKYRKGMVTSLVHLAELARREGDYPRAQELLVKALEQARSQGGASQDAQVARVLYGLGMVALHRHHYDEAEGFFQQALARRENLGNREEIARSLSDLGEVALRRKEPANAKSLFERALALRREAKDRWGVAHSLLKLAQVACEQGERELCLALCKESLPMFSHLGYDRGLADGYLVLAKVALEDGQHERAARLSGAAEAMLDALGAQVAPADRAHYESASLSGLRARVDQGAWQLGRLMSKDRALAVALDAE